MKDVTNIIRELELRRIRLGMSRRILSERAGLGIATVTRILSGKGDARLQTLLSIAEALGADIALTGKQGTRDMKDEQAKAKARRLTAIAQGSSALEGQAVNARAAQRIERQIADGLLAGPKIRLWS